VGLERSLKTAAVCEDLYRANMDHGDLDDKQSPARSSHSKASKKSVAIQKAYIALLHFCLGRCYGATIAKSKE
tara:strand:- start:4495 stop:4713 length:219 start_codon:yes stop_codon:yes gene_type:complete